MKANQNALKNVRKARSFVDDVRGESDMGNLFYILLIIVFGAALVGTIAVEVAAQESNLTGAALTLFRLLPLIFVVIIIAAAWKYVDFKR